MLIAGLQESSVNETFDGAFKKTPPAGLPPAPPQFVI